MKNCLLRTGTKARSLCRADEQISRKIVSHELGPRSYRSFVKNMLLGAMSAKFVKEAGQKWGVTCDRDISGVHCAQYQSFSE